MQSRSLTLTFASLSTGTESEEIPIDTALAEMAASHVRRLAVTDDDGRLIGILALDDVLELLVEEADSIRRLLGRHHSVPQSVDPPSPPVDPKRKTRNKTL